jgi:hypothetical protein
VRGLQACYKLGETFLQEIGSFFVWCMNMYSCCIAATASPAKPKRGTTVLHGLKASGAPGHQQLSYSITRKHSRASAP